MAFIAMAMALFPACTTMAQLTQGECMEEEQTYFLGLPMSGSRAFNESCAQMHSADLLTQTKDPGLKAVGYNVLKKISPAFETADKKFMQSLTKTPQPMECTFEGADPLTGAARYGRCHPYVPPTLKAK